MDIEEPALAPLVQEVRSGRCVAFIGAGFSAPVCQSWLGLIETIAAEESPAEVRDQVAALLADGRSESYEVAAQILEDHFADHDTASLLEVVRRHTPRRVVSEENRATVDRRKALVDGIPFAAVLTTNFDQELSGKVLDRASYASLLRDADRRWVEKRFWDPAGKTPVLKLHGDLRGDKGITLSRRGYRTRLYAEPGYLNVLRTVFMTKTLLFIGFSFTDGYLNELRSEVLAYIGKDAKTPTLAYAVLPDMVPAVEAHYAKHEGIQVFSYASGPDKRDHSAVDAFLRQLHDRTNPARVMGPRLQEKRILWVDPNEQNNEKGYRYLVKASGGLCTIDLAATPEEALARLGAAEYDLVITRWGHRGPKSSDAISLVEGMRSADRRVPVVVFASGDRARENRELALRLGMLDYVFEWDHLVEAIDRRFDPRS